MKLREKIKHEYHDSILSSKLTAEVTDRVNEQDVATAINTNVKRMWQRFYWDAYDQLSKIYEQAENLPESDEVNDLVNALSDLLRTIEQYRE